MTTTSIPTGLSPTLPLGSSLPLESWQGLLSPLPGCQATREQGLGDGAGSVASWGPGSVSGGTRALTSPRLPPRLSLLPCGLGPLAALTASLGMSDGGWPSPAARGWLGNAPSRPSSCSASSQAPQLGLLGAPTAQGPVLCRNHPQGCAWASASQRDLLSLFEAGSGRYCPGRDTSVGFPSAVSPAGLQGARPGRALPVWLVWWDACLRGPLGPPSSGQCWAPGAVDSRLSQAVGRACACACACLLPRVP